MNKFCTILLLIVFTQTITKAQEENKKTSNRKQNKFLMKQQIKQSLLSG